MQLQCQSIVCDASAWFKVCFYPFVTHVKFVLSFRASRSTSAISRAVAQSGGASKVPPAGAPVKFHFRGNDRGCNVVFVFNRQPLTLAGEHHPYMNENEVIRLAHSYFQDTALHMTFAAAGLDKDKGRDTQIDNTNVATTVASAVIKTLRFPDILRQGPTNGPNGYANELSRESCFRLASLARYQAKPNVCMCERLVHGRLTLTDPCHPPAETVHCSCVHECDPQVLTPLLKWQWRLLNQKDRHRPNVGEGLQPALAPAQQLAQSSKANWHKFACIAFGEVTSEAAAETAHGG